MGHMVIDAVAVEEADEESNIEVILQKAVTEGDSEWNRSTARKLIDTRAKRGDLAACLPRKGKFSFVHVDFDGQGGVAKVIEDFRKYGRYRVLEAISGACMGNTMVNMQAQAHQQMSNTQRDAFFASAEGMRRSFERFLSSN